MSTQTPPEHIDTQHPETTSNGDTLETQNIHASGTLGIEIELDELIQDLETGTDYSTQHGFICTQYTTPTNTGDTTTGSIQLWRTGSYTITGVATMTQLEQVETRFLNELDTLGISLEHLEHAEVSNYVTNLTLNTDKRLNLNAISIAFGLENIEYEPEQFPGVLYRPPNHNGVCLVFGSGKVVITGPKTPEDVYKLAEHVQTQLCELGII